MQWSEKTKHVCSEVIKKKNLPADFISTIEDIYLPLANGIVNKKQHSPLLVSINGAQGTGKSTLTSFLQYIIESEFSLRVADLSIDDFYYTRKDREVLSKKVHPLLMTRGVPGTHDIELLENSLGSLINQEDCRIPRFDKARDDRVADSNWCQYRQGIDIILFEGWCNHSPFQDDASLIKPVNELEQYEDQHGVWRHYVNDQLKLYHQRIFNQADMVIMLKAESFEKVYEWRKLQEDKLRKNTTSDKNFIMNDDELKRFIQHYERITRHTLLNLPDIADVTIPVAGDHKFKGGLLHDL